MYSHGYFKKIHTYWLVNIRIQIQSQIQQPEVVFVFINPCLSRFVLFYFFLTIIFVVFLQFLGRGVKGVFCSQNLCVFLSVCVVLNVVLILGGFVFSSCTKHNHQWHVNHNAYRAECIPLLCPDRRPLTIVYKTSRAFPFRVSPSSFFCFRLFVLRQF